MTKRRRRTACARFRAGYGARSIDILRVPFGAAGAWRRRASTRNVARRSRLCGADVQGAQDSEPVAGRAKHVACTLRVARRAREGEGVSARKESEKERERERGEKESARGGKQKRSQSNRMRRRRRTISAKRARRASGKARLDARRTSVSCAAESGVRVSKASSGLVETSAAGAGEMETRSACKRARAQAQRLASSTKRSRRASGESYLEGRRPLRALHNPARAREQSVERVRRNERGGRWKDGNPLRAPRNSVCARASQASSEFDETIAAGVGGILPGRKTAASNAAYCARAQAERRARSTKRERRAAGDTHRGAKQHRHGTNSTSSKCDGKREVKE